MTLTRREPGFFASGSRGGGALTLLVQVTLNPNQLRSHLEPITDLDEVGDVTLVADVAPPPLRKLRGVVAPERVVRRFGRAGAKFATTLRLALRDRPDWVVAYNLVPHGLTAIVVGRLSGARSLVHLIGGPRDWVGGGWTSDNKVLGRLGRPVPWLEHLLVAALRRADHLAVMGGGARADLLERGIPADRVTVLPAGLDESLFDRRPAAQPRYDVLTASQLNPRKRVEDLLAAAVSLRDRHPGLRIAVAGRGPLEDDLRRRAAELGLEDTVDFLGFVSDMGALYEQARVFALPSRSEGLSIAVCEAMAVGLGIVATDVGEIRDVLEPGVTGELFAVGDVDALAAGLDRLLADDALRAAMGAGARERVREHCARSVVAASSRRILLT